MEKKKNKAFFFPNLCFTGKQNKGIFHDIFLF